MGQTWAKAVTKRSGQAQRYLPTIGSVLILSGIASERRLQYRPDVIQQPRLSFSSRVNTITLHHGRHATYALQQEGHQGAPVSLATLGNTSAKAVV